MLNIFERSKNQHSVFLAFSLNRSWLRQLPSSVETRDEVRLKEFCVGSFYSNARRLVPRPLLYSLVILPDLRISNRSKKSAKSAEPICCDTHVVTYLSREIHLTTCSFCKWKRTNVTCESNGGCLRERLHEQIGDQTSGANNNSLVVSAPPLLHSASTQVKQFQINQAPSQHIYRYEI